MKKSNKLSFAEVTYVTRKLCDYIDEGEHDVIYCNVKLNDNGEKKDYVSVVACKEDEINDLIHSIREQEGKNVSDYKINSNYCHITTFDGRYRDRGYISFDMEDDYPIKASFDKKYEFIDVFFRKFLRFRNNLIENGSVVKSDDIYQYLSSVTGEFKSKKNSSLIEKAKQFFLKK